MNEISGKFCKKINEKKVVLFVSQLLSLTLKLILKETPELEVIQSLKWDTRTKTLGFPDSHNRDPKETIPISTPATTNGPPESPLQAPRVPAPEKFEVVEWKEASFIQLGNAGLIKYINEKHIKVAVSWEQFMLRRVLLTPRYYTYEFIPGETPQNLNGIQKETHIKEQSYETNVKDVDLQQIQARVDKINIDGLCRTKNDIVEDCIRDLFNAKDFFNKSFSKLIRTVCCRRE
ncbi:hypothetical protein HUJ04_001309 [Dendroctonus ponderosae]|nr:hypothetical protein HUJ04_001309 [Dendroctonus ponderosae]